jgi:hypothetical protein
MHRTCGGHNEFLAIERRRLHRLLGTLRDCDEAEAIYPDRTPPGWLDRYYRQKSLADGTPVEIRRLLLLAHQRGSVQRAIRGMTAEGQSQIEISQEVAQHLLDALLTAQSQAPHKGPP